MSLGSRIAKRGRAALKASLVSTPREPLLFLYPQWGRNSAYATPKRALNHSNATTLTAQSNTNRNRRRSLNSIQGSKSTKAEINPSPVQIQTRSFSVSAQTRDDSSETAFKGSSSNVKNDSRDTANCTTTQTAISTYTDSQKPALPPSVVNHDDSISQPSKDNTRHQRLPSLAGTEALRGSIKFEILPKTPESSTVLGDVGEMVDRILHANMKVHVSHLSARSIREQYQEFRRIIDDNWTPDWRKVVESLVRNTPRDLQWYEQQIQIVVPPEATKRLLTGVDTFIFDIGKSYGSSIAIGRHRHDTEHNSGVFIVSGTKYAISNTLADVLIIAPDAVISAHSPDQRALPGLPASGLALPELQQVPSRPLIRPVISFSRAKDARKKQDVVSKPSEWTQQTLLDYVKNLTRTHKNKTVEYPHATADALSSLFRDPNPDLRAAITRAACHEALRFFVGANQMVNVRVLLVRMELFKIPLTPETFNIMLRGVAKSKDVHNFHFILHLMFRRGFKANGHTWIAFMMSVEDFQMKIDIAMAMKSQGLLMHKSIMKGVCEQLIEPEVQLSLDAGQDQDTFVAHMDSRYGRDWLSLDSGNIALHVLGSRGLISRCWDFLHFMDSRTRTPDQYSINTILSHCKQTNNIAGAIELMQNISPAWGFEPNQETFRILFALANRNRMFNVAKVVWKYACIAGLIDRSMRLRVANSMRAAWKVPYAPKHRWIYYSGSVIFGTYGGLHPVRTLDNYTGTGPMASHKMEAWVYGEDVMNDSAPIARLDGIGPFPPNPLPLYKPDAYEQLPYQYIWRKVLERYYLAMKEEFEFDLCLPDYVAGLYPKFSFEQMLGNAWAQDQQWREDGTYRNARLRWMIANAIRIPLVSGTGTRPVISL